MKKTSGSKNVRRLTQNVLVCEILINDNIALSFGHISAFHIKSNHSDKVREVLARKIKVE